MLSRSECEVTLHGVAISSGGRTLGAADKLKVGVPKTDLFAGRFSVASVTLAGAASTIDLTGPDSVQPRQATPETKSASHLLIFAGLVPRDRPCSILFADGLNLDLRLPTGDAPLHFPNITIALTRSEAGQVRGDLSIPIGANHEGTQLTGSVIAHPETGMLDFSFRAPTFAASDLVTFMGRRWLQATVAVELNGAYDFAHGQLTRISGAINLVKGLLDLPGLRAPIPFPLFELRGVADVHSGKAHLESGRLLFGGGELNISELEAILGSRPMLRWKGALKGAQGALLSELISEVPNVHLAAPWRLLGDMNSIDGVTQGEAHMIRSNAGRWAITSIDATVGINARVGSEGVSLEGRAQQSSESAPIRMIAKLSPVRFAHLPERWQEASRLVGFDAPLTVDADASFAPTGAIESVILNLEAGPGRLTKLKPGLPALSFGSITARFESDHPETHWRVAKFSTELVDGPVMEVVDGDLDITAGQMAAHGTLHLAGVKGSFAEPWLPSTIRAAISGDRIGLADWTLDRALLASDLDFPITIQATARGSLDQGLTDLEIRLQGGPGCLRNASAPQLTLPIGDLSVNAHYDVSRRLIVLRALSLTTAGARIELADVTCSLSPPFQFNGHLQATKCLIFPLASYGAEAIIPRVRPQFRPFIREGTLENAQLKWTTVYDPSRPGRLSIVNLQGKARLTGLEALFPNRPTPLMVGELALTFQYPEITADASNVSSPGIKMSSVRIEAAALSTPQPSFTAAAHFAIDLPLAARLCAVPGAFQLEGTAEGEAKISGLVGGHEFKSAIKANLRNGAQTSTGASGVAPNELEAEVDFVDPKGAAAKPNAQFSLQASSLFGQRLKIEGRVTLDPENLRPVDCDFTSIEQGATSMQASIHQPTPGSWALKVGGARLDAAPWLRNAAIFADALADRPVTPPTPATSSAPVPKAGPEAQLSYIDADVRCNELIMGPGLVARDLQMQLHWDRREPISLSLAANMGTGKGLRASITGPANAQVAKIEVDDVATWARLWASPWREQPRPIGGWSRSMAQLAELPVIISGGNIVAEATFNRAANPWLHGRLEVTDAVLVRAPLILNLLALKSRRDLQKSPLIERLEMDDISVDRDKVRIGRTSLHGTGFVSKLKIDQAAYHPADQRLHVEGAFFGVGYEITGTRDDPQVYMKDNAFIRALGRANEFDFGPPP